MWRNGLIQLILMPLPWVLRRRLLQTLFGYDLHATARIGMSIVMPAKKLTMDRGSYIGHGTLARGMDVISLGALARIGHLNWIYAVPRSDPNLSHEPQRRPELIMDDESVITRRHLIDCSNTVRLGRRALVVGYRTQVITHGFSTTKSARLYTKPVVIGSYTLIGTGCIVLGGAVLPDYSALGAGSTLRSGFVETHSLYSGVPAERVAGIPPDSAYFKPAHDT